MELIGKIGNIGIMNMSFVTRELAEKLIVSLLAIMFLCSGCSNVNVGENIEKEPQVTEETQQVELIRQEIAEKEAPESEEKTQSERATASGKTKESDEKSEKTTNIRCDSIDQLEIQGRTQEETELIHRILSEDKEEFQEFLTTDWEFSHEEEAIEILTYDFTKDGKDEIIVSKFYLNTSAVLTYNYVYDQEGRRVMEFVGGHPMEMQIIEDWNGEGTFLLYTQNHYSSHNDAGIYTEIRYEDDALTEKVILMELDRRYGGDEGKEEYYIFKDFTKEEEEKLWYGASGVNELTKTKECFKEGEEPETYAKLFRERESDPNFFPIMSVIVYSEDDGFVEWKD